MCVCVFFSDCSFMIIHRMIPKTHVYYLFIIQYSNTISLGQKINRAKSSKLIFMAKCNERKERRNNEIYICIRMDGCGYRYIYIYMDMDMQRYFRGQKNMYRLFDLVDQKKANRKINRFDQRLEKSSIALRCGNENIHAHTQRERER